VIAERLKEQHLGERHAIGEKEVEEILSMASF
jgi:hypothetical protein